MSILNEHFYHKTITLYTSVFGNCFSDLKIVRPDGKTIAVPLAYAAQQKYNVRLDQNKDSIDDQPLITFMKRTPRMSFIMTNLTRDPNRVKNKLHQLTNVHSKNPLIDPISSQYNRVPYIFSYRLDMTTKYMDDLLQLIEQIFVVFNPSIQVIVKDNVDLDDQSAITITMLSSNLQDNFEGLFETGRDITFSIEFELEGYLYMRTDGTGIIKTVYINYYDLENPKFLVDSDKFTEDDYIP